MINLIKISIKNTKGISESRHIYNQGISDYRMSKEFLSTFLNDFALKYLFTFSTKTTRMEFHMKCMNNVFDKILKMIKDDTFVLSACR